MSAGNAQDSPGEQRRRMVASQLEARGIQDPAILEAMGTVPRERFVPEALAEFAYEDAPLPIAEGQTISQPYMVAVMLEALELGPADRLLEIGLGSGYAAAVASRIARAVYAVDRHQALVDAARRRLEDLGYDNVAVMCGDGTLGWEEHAPYEAILVSAGGPGIPDRLRRQLAVGGRLLIPIGADPRSQQLMRVRRTGPDRWEEERLGQVQFVPLIGAQGWTADGVPAVPPPRGRRTLRVPPGGRDGVARLVAEQAEPFHDLAEDSLHRLIDRIGEARVVLIGEASHGTSEFYRMRARITEELIRRRGFTVVAIEGDWPDARVIDRRVRGGTPPALRTPAFSRFPTWMWRNEETRRFVDRLASFNRGRDPERQVSVHGLDLYSLNNSIGVVLDYLESVDPEAARAARTRYGCFSPWEMDPTTYGRAASGGRMAGCEAEAVDTLADLLQQRLAYIAEDLQDGDEFFDTERNAVVVQQAERYYRAMYRGSRESWNLRDDHMFETLQAILRHRGEAARAVVWAHNSHVGNSAATEMGVRGEYNIGHLARRAYGPGAVLIGFGTHEGTVAAASDWGGPMQVMSVRPSHEESYERLCHDTGVPAFMLHLREPREPELREQLLAPRLERAIGVIYRPETELQSHYFQAALPAQFDEYVWIDRTSAVTPLPVHQAAGPAETWPFGL